MRSYFIRNRFRFDMHAAYVIVRKSGYTYMYGGTRSAWMAAAPVMAVAAVVVLYAPMMWYMVPSFCTIFSISLSLSLSRFHFAMVSLRIIVLSTISQPQNESQRKTHFRAHFIMKIHTHTHWIYIYMELCIDSFEVGWKSVNLNLHCDSGNVSWTLWKFVSLSFTLLFFSYSIWYTRSALDDTISKKVTTTTQPQQQHQRIQQKNMNLCCTFDIQHAYAHIFVLIINWKK